MAILGAGNSPSPRTSNATPRHCSLLDVNLSSLVDSLTSCGNTVSTSPNSHPVSIFLHDLYFGDKPNPLKDDNIFRIGFCNIGRFLASPTPNEKAQEIELYALHNLDIFGSCEANLNWSKLWDNLCLIEWFWDLPSC